MSSGLPYRGLFQRTPIWCKTSSPLTAPCYQYRHGRTHFRETETGTGLALQYTADDHARNIRAYVTTLLGTLRCRINIQSSDGRSTVLRYVSSYDVPTNKALYSAHLMGYQAAASFLRTVQPLEPEMFLQLTSIKQAWSSACTKWFVVLCQKKTTATLCTGNTPDDQLRIQDSASFSGYGFTTKTQQRPNGTRQARVWWP